MIQIEEFLALAKKFPVVDVRAPLEYAQGHMPGALNIPLFDNREREIVGTKYKQVNREAAMYAGLDFAGKKLVKLAKEGERAAGKNKTLLLHCWRGGMRSKSMFWLFETMGITCHLLEGGYKSYRRYIKGLMASPIKLGVIGGRTGSGKTALLHYLVQLGEQVIDLEGLAKHKGSAFGALGESEQPSTEQFENNLAHEILQLESDRITWIEDESRNIGKCVLPGEFYKQMRLGELFFLDISREERALHLVEEYSRYDPEDLKLCVNKISKRLGGERTKEAIESIEKEDFHTTAMLTLQYYDKAYMYSLKKNHESYQVLKSGTVDSAENAELLLEYEKKRRL